MSTMALRVFASNTPDGFPFNHFVRTNAFCTHTTAAPESPERIVLAGIVQSSGTSSSPTKSTTVVEGPTGSDELATAMVD